jgi:hypothetical protein
MFGEELIEVGVKGSGRDGRSLLTLRLMTGSEEIPRMMSLDGLSPIPGIQSQPTECKVGECRATVN